MLDRHFLFSLVLGVNPVVSYVSVDWRVPILLELSLSFHLVFSYFDILPFLARV
jgi:hypothetical protein